MDKNKIIISILVIVIIILISCILTMQIHSQHDTILEIKSDSKLYEGDSIKIKLNDVNNTPIANERINVTITDEDGTSSYKSVVTNSKGIAKLKLEDAGNYTVNCTYPGNEKYAGNSSLKKLTVMEEVVEAVVSSQSSQDYSTQSSSEDYRPAVDSDGITREEADEYGWEYTSDHGGHYIGSNDAWDEEAGVYHD